MTPRASFACHPATPDRWKDLERLFGEKGACAGCWCMWWRLPRAEWRAGRGEGNRRVLRSLVKTGKTPGILAYDGDRAVGWCAVAPRSDYPGLARSRVLKPVDDRPVWSVTCFFVDREYRRRGVTRALLRAAADFVREQGGGILEGYPVRATKDVPDAWVWTGLSGAFAAAGFREVAARSASRPIMRKKVAGSRKRTRAARGGGLLG